MFIDITIPSSIKIVNDVKNNSHINIKFQNSIVLFSKQRYYIISQCIRIYSYTRYIFIQYKYRHKGPCLIDNYHCLKSDHELKRCLNVNTYNVSKKISSSGCSSPYAWSVPGSVEEWRTNRWKIAGNSHFTPSPVSIDPVFFFFFSVSTRGS